jgi:hypothetical protein
MFEMDAQEFAISKMYLSDRCLVKLGSTKVAIFELAFYEMETRQVGIGKIAMGKCAVFIFSAWKGRGIEDYFFEDLVSVIAFCHVSVLLKST